MIEDYYDNDFECNYGAGSTYCGDDGRFNGGNDSIQWW